MKSILACTFLTGFAGALLTVGIYVQMTVPTSHPDAADLTAVIRELRTISQQTSETQATLKALLDGDRQARQAEQDEVAQALRLRDKMMGLTK